MSEDAQVGEIVLLVSKLSNKGFQFIPTYIAGIKENFVDQDPNGMPISKTKYMLDSVVGRYDRNDFLTLEQIINMMGREWCFGRVLDMIPPGNTGPLMDKMTVGELKVQLDKAAKVFEKRKLVTTVRLSDDLEANVNLKNGLVQLHQISTSNVFTVSFKELATLSKNIRTPGCPL